MQVALLDRGESLRLIFNTHLFAYETFHKCANQFQHNPGRDTDDYLISVWFRVLSKPREVWNTGWRRRNMGCGVDLGKGCRRIISVGVEPGQPINITQPVPLI